MGVALLFVVALPLRLYAVVGVKEGANEAQTPLRGLGAVDQWLGRKSFHVCMCVDSMNIQAKANAVTANATETPDLLLFTSTMYALRSSGDDAS